MLAAGFLWGSAAAQRIHTVQTVIPCIFFSLPGGGRIPPLHRIPIEVTGDPVSEVGNDAAATGGEHVGEQTALVVENAVRRRLPSAGLGLFRGRVRSAIGRQFAHAG
jgi:hypothetical protein